MALRTLPPGAVIGFCGCNNGKRENLLPVEALGKWDCLSCGKVYSVARLA